MHALCVQVKRECYTGIMNKRKEVWKLLETTMTVAPIKI